MNLSYYPDIPRIYTAFVEWGSCMLYLMIAEKRTNKVRFYIISIIALAIQLLYLSVTGTVPIQYWFPCMIGAVGIMYIFMKIEGGRTEYVNIYYTAKAFLLAEFIASFNWQIVLYFGPFKNSIKSVGAVILCVLSFVILAAVYIIEKKLFSEEYIQQLTWRDVLMAVGIVTVIFIFSNLSFVFNDLPFSGKTRAEIFNLRTMIDLMGVLIMVLLQQRISQCFTEREMIALQNALKSQYQKYRGIQGNMEMMNIKYHDLKHQIIGLRAETDEKYRTEWLDRLEKELDESYSFIKTGNPVLDIILADKILQCRKLKIQMTYVIEGRLIDMLHVTDICTIFGNALDNAIENTGTIITAEKRLIHVSVSAYKRFVGISVENYCEVSPDVEEGKLPKTTKADKKNHGYGMKSIRYTAERYGGSMEWKVEENWFKLLILIPQNNI